MKLYTRNGDKGTTSYLGKDKLPKDNIRIEAYGTVDELNSIIGITLQYIPNKLTNKLIEIQNLLFYIGGELASEKPRNDITSDDIALLEQWIDEATDETPELKSFILPGGTMAASWLHFARTVTRRAERLTVTFARDNLINENIIPWLNRLSDLFFAWARLVNHMENVPDTIWTKNK